MTLKSGDLVRLRQGSTGGGRKERPVIVSWEDPADRNFFSDNRNEVSFPVGTLATLIEIKEYSRLDLQVAWVLIEGRMGWVWEEEIEPIP